MKQILVLFLSIAVLSSVACKTKYSVVLVGGTSLNSVNPTSEGGAPTPVKARVYQLKDAQKFTTKTFDEVWGDAKASLGADLLDAGGEPTERTVLPMKEGQSKEYKPETADYIKEQSFDPGTQYFGVAALFKPEGEATEEQKSKWKGIVHLDEIKKKVFHLDHFELIIKEK